MSSTSRPSTSRDIEGAREALGQVLELAPEKRINGIVHSAQRVHQAITRAGLTEDAHDLIEQIEDFTLTPLKALPR